jgi:hypothetical protein
MAGDVSFYHDILSGRDGRRIEICNFTVNQKIVEIWFEMLMNNTVPK